MMNFKNLRINSPNAKLLLYVLTASLAALLSDLQRLVTVNVDPPGHTSAIHIAIIIINFVLQGLIAWRAFIDNACEEENCHKHSSLEGVKNSLENSNLKH